MGWFYGGDEIANSRSLSEERRKLHVAFSHEFLEVLVILVGLCADGLESFFKGFRVPGSRVFVRLFHQ